MREVLLR